MRRRKKIVSIQSNSAFVTTNAFVDLAISLLFSGEEGYGRYLDLYAHHTAYNNLKGLNKRLAYLQYLDVLCAAEHDLVHQEVPKETRYSRDYEQ